MAWPMRLRAMSFVIVIGVVFMETALALMPVGIALVYFGGKDALQLCRILGSIALALAVVTAINTDLGRQGYRKWWRSRA
ncbi:MAG TPA: hypothetical protein VMT64_10090 [Candidatus Binataceae bacterium]|nr:hypothetical protein [Candidatus Binataceae bacterium]